MKNYFIQKQFIQKQEASNNLFRFLPDNKTIGTEEYYRLKYGDKLPDEVYKLLEIMSREEYNDDDLKLAMKMINTAKLNYQNQLLAELHERSELPDDDRNFLDNIQFQNLKIAS